MEKGGRKDWYGSVVLVVLAAASTLLVWRYRETIIDFLSVRELADAVLVGTLFADLLLFAFLYASASSRTKGQQLTASLAALRERERELADIVDGFAIPAFVIDRERKVRHWNHAICTLTRTSAKAIIGTQKQWMPFYRRKRPVLADLIVTGKAGEIRRHYRGRVVESSLIQGAFEGEDFFPGVGAHGRWLRFTAAPVMSENGEVLGAIETIEDMTTRREAEEKLQELDRMKTEFLSVAAHQLRTPLGSMRWTVDMLQSGDLGSVPETMKTALDHLSENQQRLVRLVDDLLNVSRIEQGRVKDEPAVVDLASVAARLIEDLQGEAQKRRIVLSLKTQKQAALIRVDEDRLRDVLLNLLSNALKYNRPDGRVRVEVAHESKFVVLKVIDTGMGIPKKDQSRVFSKFFRAGNAVKSETEGSGLGLFVVKSYVERAGGKITFQSVEGKGSTFVVRYPRVTK